jgi:hypothetical protein
MRKMIVSWSQQSRWHDRIKRDCGRITNNRSRRGIFAIGSDPTKWHQTVERRLPFCAIAALRDAQRIGHAGNHVA